MFAVLKREFRSYFQNVIGWLFVAALMALFGLYFYVYNLRQGYPYLYYTLSAITIIFMIAVPILTMRSFAEDRKNKTDQLMLTAPVPNVPWQDRPAGPQNGAPIWRYSENPIIGRNPVKGVARIFNSAVMPYGDAFIGVFRGEQTNGIPYIYLGHSKDAIHWDFEENKIPFVDENGDPFMPIYAYDPRLVKVEDTYYIIWCQDFYGAAIGMAKTTDFKTFTRIENPFLPFNRNAVLFPRKINGCLLYTSDAADE